MIQVGYSQICIVVNGDNMNCGQMIEELKKFPKNKPVMIMGGTVLQKLTNLKTLTVYVLFRKLTLTH